MNGFALILGYERFMNEKILETFSKNFYHRFDSINLLILAKMYKNILLKVSNAKIPPISLSY